jgi:hypothetical protein
LASSSIVHRHASFRPWLREERCGRGSFLALLCAAYLLSVWVWVRNNEAQPASFQPATGRSRRGRPSSVNGDAGEGCRTACALRGGLSGLRGAGIGYLSHFPVRLSPAPWEFLLWLAAVRRLLHRFCFTGVEVCSVAPLSSGRSAYFCALGSMVPYHRRCFPHVPPRWFLETWRDGQNWSRS